MRVALLQMTAGIDPQANAAVLEAGLAEAAAGGAIICFTPEMSGLLDRDRQRAMPHMRDVSEDIVLARVRTAARANEIWVALGSLAVRGPGNRLANRSFVIDAKGEIVAEYDKMHMFDVDVGAGNSWRESAAYAPGDRAVTVETPIGTLGLTICYDLRFPALHAALSAAGATVIACPAAFTVPTGEAHWHVLQRARAIENAAFVVAAAQSGRHEDGRETYGHSLVVDPWGRILLDMGQAPGVGFCDLDLAAVDAVRGKIPVIAHRRTIGAAQ
jgi:predicted amidohydrolase